jgi:4-hydroxybenzoate polyprenyltransferase
MQSEVMHAAPGTAVADRPGTVRSLSSLLSCIRFDEILVLQGTPLLGAVFSVGRLTAERAVTLSALAAGSCCLVAHVFVLNDWSGISADLQDPNRTSRVFTTKSIDRTEIGYLWMALLALSLLLLSGLGSRTLVIALAIASLSALYSAPASNVKGVPLLSSALHLIGGILHFLLGYSLFSAIDRRGLEIAGFFALTFAAGHLNHEARDHEGDRLNGITTNAVTFGKARSFAAGLALFTIADALLIVLAARGTVPRALVLVAALYPLHLFWSLRALRAGLTFNSIRRLQLCYRGLYAIIGLVMVLAVLLAH